MMMLMYTCIQNSITSTKLTVFCPGFENGRVPSEKGQNQRGERNKKGTVNAVNGTKTALLTRSMEKMGTINALNAVCGQQKEQKSSKSHVTL